MKQRKIYYTATILYENDDNHSAESGVFTTPEKAMEWIEQEAETWKNDQDLENTVERQGSEKLEVWDEDTMLYHFTGTVGKVYINDPMGYIADCIRRNNEILSEQC